MTQRLFLLILFIPAITVGQFKPNEKFINDAFNENNYLVFHQDSTFKYRLAYHLFHDISCGRYKLINDTIFLYYESDLRETFCNKEIDVSNFDSSSLTLRPKTLFYKDDKLYLVQNGQVIDKTEKFQPDWKIPRESRKYYRHKYWLFGPLVLKTKKTYYMIAASKVKWANEN